jgi:hypothetical protein
MTIDFAPVHRGDITLQGLAAPASRADLRAVTNDLMDAIRAYLVPATDQEVIYVPHDPEADDPYAVAGEEKIGWSLAHLVVHVTASSEEGAAFASLLARGIAIGGRLRYETHWRSVTTQDQCLRRIEESRRMCLAYLDTWPEEPHLEVYREIPPELEAKFGRMNAPVAYLFGLYHQWQHLGQFEWTLHAAQQAGDR